jgi:hypothetical protein
MCDRGVNCGICRKNEAVFGSRLMRNMEEVRLLGWWRWAIMWCVWVGEDGEFRPA